MSLPPNETPMMRQFNAAKKECPDAILFFRMGDFYEMFGDDAVCAAKILQIALTSRNKNEANALPMCGVPYHAYEQYLNKLTAAGFKVAICEQMEDPATAKGIVDRQVVRVVTPGTTVSPQLIAADRNHYLVALSPQLLRKKIGVAFADVSTGEFEVTEFAVSELTRLYDFLFQLVPQEILLPQSRSAGDSRFLEDLQTQVELLLRRVALHPRPFTFLDPYYFDPEPARRRLLEHFKTHNLAGFGVDHLEFGVTAAGALFRYLSETQKCDLEHLTSLRQHTFEEMMLLDEVTLANLELFENASGGQQYTLYGVLNHTKTPMGARLLRQWLRQPLLKLEAIEARLESLADLQHQFMLCEELRTQLKEIQDLPRLAARLSLPVAGINDLVGLRESLIPVLQLPKFWSNFRAPLLQQIAAEFDPLEDLAQYLQRHLLPTPATKLREGGFIAEGISAELDELRHLSHNSKQVLNELTQQERLRTGINSLKISYNKVFGYYLEISNAHKSAIPENYIRKQTLANAERFITPELKELEEKILSAEERINDLEYQLFQDLKAHVVHQIARVQRTSQQIAVLDVLAALAYVAECNNYIRPKLYALEAPRKLKLQHSRHPVIEQIDLGTPFVANDLELNETHCQVMLITGPNMAGKSTYMRQVALNILMAQCGCYVPAQSAELSLVDRIFTRVGASDNLSRGQSTFMVEMNEAAAILNNATARSLIILDEIGRGTSTFDGISIAWAIVEHIHQLGALTLCATHYHELTALSQELMRVQNFNILVQEEAEHIVFMRKIVSGEADKSYGVHVAKLAGLPKSVVERAMQVMAELETNSVVTHLPQTPPELEVKPAPPGKKASRPPVNSPQLSLFPDESTYVQELRQVDLNNLTPLQALNYLHELIGRIKQGI